MIRIILIGAIFISSISALDIPTKKVTMRTFTQTLKVNSQIIQLTNAKQSIMSRMEGKVAEYFVTVGDIVKKGEKIARVESIELSQLSAELSSLEQQLKPVSKNYLTSKKLYKSGMASQQELNERSIEYNTMKSKIESIQSNLALMGANKTSSDSYILYAYSDGIVTDILKPLHAIVGRAEPLVTIANEESIYVKSYLPLAYAKKIKIGQKSDIQYAGETIEIEVSQILHQLDKVTQQVVVLSKVGESKLHLFINAFVETIFYFGSAKSYTSIDKSALTLYQDEWVVFVPKEHEEHLEHTEKHYDELEVYLEHGDEHEKHPEHKEEHHKEHEEHLEHKNEHNEEDEIPYDIRVINIIKTNREFVAIEGLDEGDEYVSDKSYYIKSLLLKASLGGHGH